MRISPSTSFLASTIGTVCGNLLQSCDSTKTHAREMFERRLGSYTENASDGSSRGHDHFNRKDEELDQRDEELELLRRLMRDLELQARGRHQRRDHGE